jgi:UDP-N-acetylglucosamine--N-acetylmuramyl-(pentapeptide) pyrophosphoryl-undecaprenol N-acetylglucosamine transferase
VRVVIAGGGTGGHLYPGIAVADKLKKVGITPFFIVSNRGIERKILSPMGYGFIEQKETPVKGVPFLRKIKSGLNIINNIISTYRVIKKGDYVLLLGGFASFSAGTIAIIKSVPLYIHEQNSVMGLSNRIFSRFARKVFLSFENIHGVRNAIYTGNPVREVFKNAVTKTEPDRRILVLGGSQGSRFINNLIIGIAKTLLDGGFTIVHQTGEKLHDEVVEGYRGKGVDIEKLTVKAYIDDVATHMKWADIIISRAGAGSVYEIMYSKRYGIFIPFAGATDNHQELNAMFAVQKGIGVSISEKEATPDKLLGEIKSYYENFYKIKSNLENVTFTDSAALMIKEMGLADV